MRDLSILVAAAGAWSGRVVGREPDHQFETDADTVERGVAASLQRDRERNPGAISRAEAKRARIAARNARLVASGGFR